MDIVVAFAVGLIVLCLIGKIVSLPMKLLWKLITNSIVGAVLLWVVNLFGAGIQITFIKALIAGVLGVPGVIIVLLMK
ncbi:inhibitor of the pro-sigma K processing machinery [Selenomonas sp. WCT3]|uniref:pro-sigmaK processing inhibitor BofA family protein n=1 Tax=unclassified Selenomonas TaxID=2637378 RepID=UPI0008813CF2|nr:pro-sigmaK processing inhibitor BofA family protein [Selenomonas sp.]MCR5438697.1 pro-sigmaK processing inhibitor BofA family protein [Selenomonas sp.]SDH05508.1 inhibitor of the pro-sigma K processing machinery [Selenomonas ruminantium]